MCVTTRSIVPGILFLLLPPIALVTGCNRHAAKSASAAPPPPLVEVIDVVQRDEPIHEEWIGTLDGLVNAQIRAQVTGYLQKQAYTEGAAVKKGDLLFEIDPRTFEAAYGQVKANYDKAELDLQRAETLSQENAASKQERDNAFHARNALKASLDAVKLNLEFTRIGSPIDGIAGIATAQIGDLVGPNSGVLTTVSTIDPIKAYFAISEQSYLEFKRGAPGQPKFPDDLEFELITADGNVYPQKGKFLALDRQVDTNTGTLRVAATFPNPAFLLRPGQYARVRAVVRTRQGALLVPQRAVSELQGSFQVTTVDADSKAHVHNVKLGNRVGSWWIIEEGLKPGDRVIVEGAGKAREGTVVNPQPYQTAAEKAAKEAKQ